MYVPHLDVVLESSLCTPVIHSHSHLFLSSIGISSLSKELYAGYSNQQLVAWVKPRHEHREEQDFEHLSLTTLSTRRDYKTHIKALFQLFFFRFHARYYVIVIFYFIRYIIITIHCNINNTFFMYLLLVTCACALLITIAWSSNFADYNIGRYGILPLARLEQTRTYGLELIYRETY